MLKRVSTISSKQSQKICQLWFLLVSLQRYKQTSEERTTPRTNERSALQWCHSIHLWKHNHLCAADQIAIIMVRSQKLWLIAVSAIPKSTRICSANSHLKKTFPSTHLETVVRGTCTAKRHKISLFFESILWWQVDRRWTKAGWLFPLSL